MPLKRFDRLITFIDLLTRNSVLGLILFYRGSLGVLLGGHCRFEPSCSCYAEQAFKKFRFGSALRLVLLRLSKCRPGGPFGLDPLPKPERI